MAPRVARTSPIANACLVFHWVHVLQNWISFPPPISVGLSGLQEGARSLVAGVGLAVRAPCRRVRCRRREDHESQESLYGDAP